MLIIVLLLVMIILFQNIKNNALKMWMAEHYCIVPTNEDEAKYMSKYFSNSIAKIKIGGKIYKLKLIEFIVSILTRLIYFKYRLTLSYKKLVEFDS